MKKITEKDKAIRLIEGDIVKIGDNWFRLKRFPDDYDGITCQDCEFYSICRIEHAVICAVCEAISDQRCMLELANAER